MLNSLLYISDTRVAKHDQAFEVERILRISRRRNAALGVTGALVSTVEYFAQVLEGDKTAIDELMHSISRDLRHHQVRIVMSHQLPRRLFPDWELAYAGSSAYLDRYTAAFAASPGPREARDFVQVIRQFSSGRTNRRLDRAG